MKKGKKKKPKFVGSSSECIRTIQLAILRDLKEMHKKKTDLGRVFIRNLHDLKDQSKSQCKKNTLFRVE